MVDFMEVIPSENKDINKIINKINKLYEIIR